MGDSLNGSVFTKNTNKASIVISDNKVSKRGSVALIQKESSRPLSRHAALIGRGKIGSGFVGDIALFLLKVAALETARRFSKAKCPFVWRGIQALLILSYPPFKWIQRFSPFKGLVRGVEMFSRPMLALSIATAFTVEPESNNVAPDSVPEDDPSSDVRSEISVQDEVETRVSAEIPQSSGSEIWITQLYDMLEKQGVVLPERINEDELRRFYTAANGDFPCFVSLITKTVRWRDTYRILSPEELEPWSNMVYWHGFDVKQRPCLIVRLGLACSTMPPSDRPRFAQAIISQVEHGVLELLDAESPEMTVLVDCDGLTPLRVPMQIMRTCSTLLQDHFPNRLGCLFIVRLPPVLRVIAQTFIQMLKPVTRKKLKVEGDLFLKVLSEYLEVLPSYLDGKCTCDKCLAIGCLSLSRRRNGTVGTESPDDGFDGKDRMSLDTTNETDGADSDLNCDQVLRTAVISVLMIWVFIALAAGIYDPESRPFFTST